MQILGGVKSPLVKTWGVRLPSCDCPPALLPPPPSPCPTTSDGANFHGNLTCELHNGVCWTATSAIWSVVISLNMFFVKSATQIINEVIHFLPRPPPPNITCWPCTFNHRQGKRLKFGPDQTKRTNQLQCRKGSALVSPFVVLVYVLL